MLIDDLKRELNIDFLDISQDDKLEYLIRKSKKEIDIYLRVKTNFENTIENEAFEKKYSEAIVEFSKYKYNTTNSKPVDGNIKSYTEGKRSITYRDNTSLADSIPLEVRRLLPYPSLVMW